MSSITLVLDSGEALIGDLHPPEFALPDAFDLTCQSWRKLAACGARMFYPSHSQPFPIEKIQDQLDACGA